MSKTPKKKRRAWVIMLPFWAAIVLLFVGYVSTQTARYRHYRTELNQLLAELAEEKQYSIDLVNRKFFYGGDTHIEQLARERLGFVRSDEIIFENIAE